MTIVECPREQDVADAVATGRWPDRCDEELRDHVAACRGCADLAEILLPVSRAWESARTDAPLPSSAVVWWRAQLRARQEAAHVAAQPVTVVQGLGLATGLVLGGVIVVALLPWLTGSFEGLRETASGLFTVNVPQMPAVSTNWLVAAIAAGAALALTTIAVYVVVVED